MPLPTLARAALRQPQRLRIPQLSSRTYTSPRAIPPTPRTGYAPSPKAKLPPPARPPPSSANWSDNLPGAVVPVFIMATAIFLALSLLRTHLSHNRSLAESDERILVLEAQLARLRGEAKRRQAREQKERERILPLVVQSVLQRVGALRPEAEEEEVVEDRLLV